MRTVACQMADARGRQGDDPARARRRRRAKRRRSAPSGKTYDFLGWRRAYVEDVDEDDEVEDAKRACRRSPRATASRAPSSRPSGHETKPPARYTEASLVKELEERGIGRPSTYAAVIETIQARSYVWRRAPRSCPTWTAFAITQPARAALRRTSSTTASPPRWKRRSTSIARGEGEAEKWLHSFYFGNGTPGLRELVSDEHARADRPARRQHDPDRHRRHRPRDHRAGRPVRAVRAARRRRDRVAAARDRARRADGRARARADRAAGRRARRRSAPIPRPELPVLRAHRSLRAVRAARRAGRRLEEEAEARVAVRDADAGDGHARRGAAAAVAAARRRRRRRRREIVASPGRFGPYLEARRRRHAQPRGGGAAVHGHARRSRGAVRAAEAAARPPAEAADRRARRAPRHRARRCACSKVATARTSPTAA